MTEFSTMRTGRRARFAEGAAWSRQPWWYRVWVSVGTGAARRIGARPGALRDFRED